VLTIKEREHFPDIFIKLESKWITRENVIFTVLWNRRLI
jgi:hypothetical protein